MNIARYFIGIVLGGFALVVTATPVSLIPLPAKITLSSGTFKVDASTPIVVMGHDAVTKQTAAYFAALVSRTRGLSLAVKQSGAPNAIVLQRDSAAVVANPEGYTLDVAPQGIRVTARTDAGLSTAL